MAETSVQFAAEAAIPPHGPVQRALLDWYASHGRDLPWRRTHDPYAILVAEVMLQQTQVERVLPKYGEFLERFPTLRALAAASRAEVIRAWSPLGYNLRAVRLHDIARQSVERFGGQLPADEQTLLQLKGLGPYTAAAVACFAFGQPSPTVDTNIRRVLGRVFLGEPDPRELPRREIDDLAATALPPRQAYDWNQALMDLGATICLSRRPLCQRCPLAEQCLARPKFERVSAEGGIRERRAAYRVQPTFAGSSRYYRGRVVDILRSASDEQGMDLLALGEHIKADFSESDLDWLLDLVRRLERDGLVRFASDHRVALA